MPTGGHKAEQHNADGERLVGRHLRPQLLEAAQQKPCVVCFLKSDVIPPAAQIGDP